MSDLSSGITPISSRIEPINSTKDTSITLKINGLPYIFDPSKNQDPSMASKAIVVQPNAQRRSENSSLGNSAYATVYHISLDPTENLDADEESALEEPVEPIDEEMDEKEDSEEPSFSDNKPLLQDGDFLSDEDLKEALYELMAEETFLDQAAKKMWQKARGALLESFQKKHKLHAFSPLQLGAVSYFTLLSK